MTKQEAEKKWWYRLIKIVFIILILISLTPIIAIYFDNKPTLNSYDSHFGLKCNDGRIEQDFAGYLDIDYPQKTFTQSLGIERYNLKDRSSKLSCSSYLTEDIDLKTFKELMTTGRSGKFSLPEEKNYEIVLIKPVYYGSWWSVISYTFLNIVIVIFIFSVLRAVFLYVAFAESFWTNLFSFLKWLRNLNK